MITEKHLADVMAKIEQRIEAAEADRNRHRANVRKPDVPDYLVREKGRGGRWHRQQMYRCMTVVGTLGWVKQLLEDPVRAAKTREMVQEEAEKLAEALQGIFPGSTVKGYSSM